MGKRKEGCVYSRRNYIDILCWIAIFRGPHIISALVMANKKNAAFPRSLNIPFIWVWPGITSLDCRIRIAKGISSQGRQEVNDEMFTKSIQG